MWGGVSFMTWPVLCPPSGAPPVGQKMIVLSHNKDIFYDIFCLNTNPGRGDHSRVPPFGVSTALLGRVLTHCKHHSDEISCPPSGSSADALILSRRATVVAIRIFFLNVVSCGVVLSGDWRCKCWFLLYSLTDSRVLSLTRII